LCVVTRISRIIFIIMSFPLLCRLIIFVCCCYSYYACFGVLFMLLCLRILTFLLIMCIRLLIRLRIVLIVFVLLCSFLFFV